jgi:hypothetical protein
MCFTVNGQMQLTPYTTAFLAMLFDFPRLHRRPSARWNQLPGVRFHPGGRFETDINRLCALADTGVIRAAQRNIHQCKNGINKTLRSPQGQPEHAFNDQNGGDGEIRIALRSSP